MHESELGSKWKLNLDKGGVKSEGEKEKKLRVDEEAKSLGLLFGTHLGAARVAKQPCRAQ